MFCMRLTHRRSLHDQDRNVPDGRSVRPSLGFERIFSRQKESENSLEVGLPRPGRQRRKRRGGGGDGTDNRIDRRDV